MRGGRSSLNNSEDNSNNPGDSNNTGSDSEKVTIDFFGWGSAEEQENFQIMIDKFTELNPNISVVYNATAANNYVTALDNKANKLPDVFYMPDYEFLQWADTGKLLDLSSYLTEDEISNVWSVGIDMYRYDIDTSTLGTGDAIYGLPKDLGPYSLVFNKTLMKKIIADKNLNITDLKAKYNTDDDGLPNREEPMSWNDFTNYLMEFKGQTTSQGQTIYPIGYYEPMHAVYSNNSDFWSEDTRTSNLTDPNFVQAIQWVADLGNVYGVAPDSKSAKSSNGYQKFLNQTALMTFMGPWDQKLYWRDLSFDFDVMPTPYGPAQGAKSTSWLGSVALSVKGNWGKDDKSQKEKEAAVKLAKFLTLSEECARMNYELGQAQPNVKSIAQNDWVNNVGLGREEYNNRDVMPLSKNVWLDITQETDNIKHHLRARYYIFDNSVYNDLISDISDKVNSGEQTAQEFVNSYNTSYQKKLTESYNNNH